MAAKSGSRIREGVDDDNGDGNVVVAMVEDTCELCGEKDLGISIVALEPTVVLIFSFARFEPGNSRGLDRWQP